MDHDIDPNLPVWDRSERQDGTFVRADFTYDQDRDLYVCPGGKILKTTGTLHSDRTYRYVASKRECDRCPLKPRCCPNMPARRVLRDLNETARDYTRAVMETKAYRISRTERKKIERLFGEVKHILALTRLSLRGRSGARDEGLLAVTVQADDNEFDIDIDSISAADVDIVEAGFDIDVDALAADADSEDSEDAAPGHKGDA